VTTRSIKELTFLPEHTFPDGRRIPWTAAPRAAAESISPAGSGAHIPPRYIGQRGCGVVRVGLGKSWLIPLQIQDVVGMSIQMIER
jgi:hypothetical protein